jgi:hypothetical protein
MCILSIKLDLQILSLKIKIWVVTPSLDRLMKTLEGDTEAEWVQEKDKMGHG